MNTPLACLLRAALAGMLLAFAPAWAASPSPIDIETAIRDLKSADWILQAEAANQLATWNVKEAIGPLRELLSGRGHPWVRGRALVALARMQGDAVLGDLLAFAENEAPDLRAAAMEALGLVGSPRGLPALEKHLADPAAPVRHQAIVAYARLQRQDAYDQIAPLLKDADPATVQHAAIALVYVATPEATVQLVGLLDHKEAEVRMQAVATLQELRLPETIPALLSRLAREPDNDIKRACEKALGCFEPQVLAEPLLDIVASDNRDLYSVALDLLRRNPSPDVCQRLAALLREQDKKYADFAHQMMHVLAKGSPDAYQDIFVSYLDHKQSHIRREAVLSIARCDQADRFALLQKHLVDPDGGVRYAAFDAIEKQTKGAPPGGIVEYLDAPFHSREGDILDRAAKLLAERITPQEFPKATAALDAALSGSDDWRRQIVLKALEGATDEGVQRKIAAAQGYLTEWMVLGPFPCDERSWGFTQVYPPEIEIDLTRKYDLWVLDPAAYLKVERVPCGNLERKCLLMMSPCEDGAPGSTMGVFLLSLPQRDPLTLKMLVGLPRGGAPDDNQRFAVSIDGKRIFERSVGRAEGWQPADVDLAPYAGKNATIELIVDNTLQGRRIESAIAEPQIVSADQVVADLLALAPAAVARTIDPRVAPAQIAWQPCNAAHADGSLDLQAAMPAAERAVAFALTDIESPADQDVKLWVQGDDNFILWINGTKAAEHRSADVKSVQTVLKKGRTRLLLKVTNNSGGWFFRVRVSDLKGRRIDGLTAAINPPEL